MTPDYHSIGSTSRYGMRGVDSTPAFQLTPRARYTLHSFACMRDPDKYYFRILPLSTLVFPTPRRVEGAPALRVQELSGHL